MIKLKLDEQATLLASMGLNVKKKYFDNTTPKDTTNTFIALEILEDATFDYLKEYLDPDDPETATEIADGAVLATVSFPVGFTKLGYFEEVHISAGAICGWYF